MLYLPTLSAELWFVVACLSVWRITSVLHAERIGAPIRKLFGAQETDDTIIYPDTFFGHLIECFWCLSFWVSIGVTVGMFLLPWVFIPFAFSAAAILINNLISNGRG